MTFIDKCIISMSNNYELKKTLHCCDKKGGKGWGIIKSTVNDSVPEQYKILLLVLILYFTNKSSLTCEII